MTKNDIIYNNFTENNTIKKFEELTISDDFMFGIIMRQAKYCKPFLETILGIKINHIEYPKIQEVLDVDIKAKSVRLDVYVDDGQNTIYNIEMQNSQNRNLPMRMRYYQDIIDLDLIDKGQDYDTLKKNIVIFVCTFDPFNLGRHYYSFENTCLEDCNLKLNDGTTKILLNTKGVIDDISPELKILLDFIDGKEPEDDLTRVLSGAVLDARHSRKWRVQYMNLNLAYREKLREGQRIGEKTALEQTAKRMLASKKLSVEEISAFTGLSIDEIQSLKED